MPDLTTLLVQCWSGTAAPYSPVTITSLNPASLSSVTANFTSTANVTCRANSNGGAGATGATGSAGPAVTGTGLVKVNAGAAALATAGTDYVAPSDSRLTDARNPLPHAATHAIGQPDVISPALIGAAAINASTTGNAATATALATLPLLCPAGQYPLGVLRSGNATGCTVAGTGGALPAGVTSDGANGLNVAGGGNFGGPLVVGTTVSAARLLGDSTPTLPTGLVAAHDFGAQVNLAKATSTIGDASYTGNGVTVVTRTAASADPYFGFSASSLTPTAADSNIRQTVSLRPLTNYMLSVYLRSATGANLTPSFYVYRPDYGQVFATCPQTVTIFWARYQCTFTPGYFEGGAILSIGGGNSWATGATMYAYGIQVEALAPGQTTASAYQATVNPSLYLASGALGPYNALPGTASDPAVTGAGLVFGSAGFLTGMPVLGGVWTRCQAGTQYVDCTDSAGHKYRDGQAAPLAVTYDLSVGGAASGHIISWQGVWNRVFTTADAAQVYSYQKWRARPLTIGAGWGNSPRVLVLSDSILADYSILQRIQYIYPNARVELQAAGGSESAIGFVGASTDTQVFASTGNLLPTTDITTWANAAGKSVAAQSPTTFLPMVQLTATVSNIQAPITVPVGATGLTFSLDWESGMYVGGLVLGLYNTTRAGAVCSVNDIPYGGFPSRMYVSCGSADGAGFAAGDTVQAQIVSGPSGTFFVAQPLVNVGRLPSVYNATTGTPQTATAASWVTPTPGVRRQYYDLAVIQFARNDLVRNTSAVFQQAVDAVVSGAAQYAPRILIMTPPPLSLANFSAWDTVGDTFISSGYFSALQAVSLARNVPLWDMWSEFKLLASAGTYTIAQLMRDSVHPTITGAGIGIQQYVDAMVFAGNNYVDVPATFGPTPFVRLGHPASGGWVDSALATGIGVLSAFGGSGMTGSAGGDHQYAFSSSTVGDAVSYNVTTQTGLIGLVYLGDGVNYGVVNVAVDGGAPTSLSTLDGANTMLYRGKIVASGLTPGAHTVTVTVVSGTPYLVGIAGV